MPKLKIKRIKYKTTKNKNKRKGESMNVKKLIIWQIVATLIVLATFFIVLNISGDKKITTVVATIVAALVGFIVTFKDEAAIVAAAVATVAAVAAFVTTITVIVATITVAAFVTTITAVAVATVAVQTVNKFKNKATELNKTKINKKIIWFSCAVQFVVTLMPMLFFIWR
jgi:hypothetical protein